MPSTAHLKFLPDRPTEIDALGIHKAIAESIKCIVAGELPKPFVIGLFGSWGSGKSSVVEMLRKSPQRTFRMVVIDAWRLDKSNFLREFVKCSASELLPADEAKTIQDKVNFKTAEQQSVWKPDRWGRIIFIAYIAAALSLVAALIWAWLTIHDDKTWKDFPVREVGMILFTLLTACAVQWLLPRFSRKVDTRTEEISIDDPAWFRQIYFNDILQCATGQTVLVVVDNLDRVSGEDALAIIKFVKTFVVDAEAEGISPNKAKVAFLIPCDDEALKERIEKHDSPATVVVGDMTLGNIYSPARSNKPNEFLRKFINVSLRIPSLLDQDNTKYIRGLVVETGIAADSRVIDDMAFMIARASSENPRRPKTILNHFVARYNLALTFEGCAPTVKEHPDWFLAYSIFESEFGGFNVRDFHEPSQFLRDSLPSSPGEAFRNAIAPIIGGVTNEVWRAFQFLKKPNVHDSIPKFRELVEFGLTRNSDEFTKLLSPPNEIHPNLLSYLWRERGDNPSRIAFAECILRAREANPAIHISHVILNDIGNLIQLSTKGWMHFPFGPTWELVMKERKDCTMSALRSFNSGEYDRSPKPQAFLHGLVKASLENTLTNEAVGIIIHILETLHEDDDVLVSMALKHPNVVSEKVFEVAINQAIDGKNNTTARHILRFIYSPEVSKQPSRYLTVLRKRCTVLLVEFSVLGQQRQLSLINMCRCYLTCIADGTIPVIPVPEDDGFCKLLYQLFQRLRNHNAEIVFAFLSLFLDLASIDKKNTVTVFARTAVRDIPFDAFFAKAPEALVKTFIQQHKTVLIQAGVGNVESFISRYAPE